MANILGAGGRGRAEKRGPRDLIFEEIVPSSGWTEDSDCRCLIVDLPGFKKDEVKLQVDNYGHLVVSGERQVNEMKHIRFEQSYRVPDNSNIEDTTAKFEDDILYIFIPKISTAEIENNGEKNNAQADHIHDVNQESELDKGEVCYEANIGSHQRSEERMCEEEKEEEQKQEEAEEFHEAKRENQWNEGSLMGTLRGQLKRNKCIFITAILAFSLGVLVSQKFQTNHET